MKYPALCPWVELSEDAGGLYLTDTRRNKRYRALPRFIPLIRGLDGRTAPQAVDPQLSAEDTAYLMEKLGECKLIRQKPGLSGAGLCVQFTIPLPRCTRLGRLRAAFFTRLLVKLWLPTLICGIGHVFTTPIALYGGGELFGAAAGLILGMLLHESAHACTCMAYGGQVHGCGVMLWLLMPGAFVELDVSPVKDPLRRAQIFAAGVEMNFALTGAFLLCTAIPCLPDGACLCAALCNGVLALLNLTLAYGLDGSHILSALLGVENICGMAWDVLSNRTHRRTLRRQGLSGKAALAFCIMGLTMLLWLPLVVLVNLSEVLIWFF